MTVKITSIKEGVQKESHDSASHLAFMKSHVVVSINFFLLLAINSYCKIYTIFIMKYQAFILKVIFQLK